MNKNRFGNIGICCDKLAIAVKMENVIFDKRFNEFCVQSGTYDALTNIKFCPFCGIKLHVVEFKIIILDNETANEINECLLDMEANHGGAGLILDKFQKLMLDSKK